MDTKKKMHWVKNSLFSVCKLTQKKLLPLAATCSHLTPLAATWRQKFLPTEKMASSGGTIFFMWLQVAASGGKICSQIEISEGCSHITWRQNLTPRDVASEFLASEFWRHVMWRQNFVASSGCKKNILHPLEATWLQVAAKGCRNFSWRHMWRQVASSGSNFFWVSWDLLIFRFRFL